MSRVSEQSKQMPRPWTKAVKQRYSSYGQGGNGKANLACANLPCPPSTRPTLVADALRQRSLRTLYCLFQLFAYLTRRPHVLMTLISERMTTLGSYLAGAKRVKRV
jgi:hypothetical protein